ncbi:MAG: hypothetical protein ACJ73E_05635 [Mycobacteriales bacterium]
MTDQPYNSVITRIEEGSSWLGRRQVPPAGRRIVYTDAHGKTVEVHSALTRGESAFGNIRRRYEVDVTPHSVEVMLELPAMGDALFFSCRARAVWQVHDARAVVDSGGVDGDAACRAFLEAEMPRVSREFRATDAAAVEEALRLRFATAEVLANGMTIRNVTAMVRLTEETAKVIAANTRHGWTLDETDRDADLSRQQAQHAADAERAKARQEAELERARVEHEAELEQIRADSAAARAHAQADANAEVEVARARYEQQLADFRRAREVLEQRHAEALKREREQGLLALLGHGVPGLIAKLLDQNPDQVGVVMDKLFQLQKDGDLAATQLLQQLRDDEVLEEHDIAELAPAVIGHIKQQLSSVGLPNSVLTGVTSAAALEARDGLLTVDLPSVAPAGTAGEPGESDQPIPPAAGHSDD